MIPSHAGPRLFARIDRFHVECPKCLTLIVSDSDPRLDARTFTPTEQKGTKRVRARRERAEPNKAHPYNPYLAQLRCPVCSAVYFVGLLLWSPKPNARTLNLPPSDTVPTPQQRAALRARAASYWAKRTQAAGGKVNRDAGECSCPEECPVHGGDDDPT